MVSYDIVSLFTNVPINETIDIILEKAFSIKHRSVVKRTRTVFDRVEVKRKGRKGPNYRPTYELVPREITESVEQFNGLEKHQLKKLLVICTQKSHFQFKGNFFDQIDGVAMGSPLGPLFANIFMDEFEQSKMKKLTELGVKIWLRYVDDVFAIIEHESQSDAILDYLNKQHINIKFTIESEKHSKLPFLDTKVTRKQNEFTTTIYHKPTFTGVYLNWFTSRKYRISLVYCLCDRKWKICQNQQDRDLELKKLKQILAKNEYPDHIINKEIDKFIENRTTKEQQQTPQEQQATVEKQKKYIVLPYSNNKVDAFADRLTKLVNETFDVELRVAFKAPNEIGKLFPFKDNIK